MAYDVQGTLLEVCTCDVHCGCCWADERPTGDLCDRVLAWQIESGQIDGIDVSGVTVAMLGVLDAEGHPVKAMLYLPDSIGDDAFTALVALWSGAKGGPVADLARMLGEIVGAERASIEYGPGGHLVIGSQVDALVGQTSESSHELSAGATGAVGTAGGYRVDAPRLGVSVSVSGQRALQGEFHFAD